jgi:Ca2+-dependent lipid-binding protein
MNHFTFLQVQKYYDLISNHLNFLQVQIVICGLRNNEMDIKTFLPSFDQIDYSWIASEWKRWKHMVNQIVKHIVASQVIVLVY